MSYSIYYNTAFLKMGDQILPLAEIGSNNCYSGNKRARNWQIDSYLSPTHQPLTITEIWAKVEEELKHQATKENFSEKDWGSFAGFTLYGMHWRRFTFKYWKNWLRKAIENAKTIEEYKSLGVHFTLNLPTHQWAARKANNLEIWKETRLEGPEILQSWLANMGTPHIYLYGKLPAPPKKKRGRRQPIAVNTYYAITCPEGYFLRNIRHGYKYTFEPHLRFASKAKATHALNTRCKGRDWQVKEFYSPTPVYL